MKSIKTICFLVCLFFVVQNVTAIGGVFGNLFGRPNKIAVVLGEYIPLQDVRWQEAFDTQLSDADVQFDILYGRSNGQTFESEFLKAIRRRYKVIVAPQRFFGAQALDLIREADSESRFVVFRSRYESENIPDNVTLVDVRDHENAYIAGVIAAHVTDNYESDFYVNDDNIVGLISSASTPHIERNVVAFREGVKSVDPDIEILHSYVDDSVGEDEMYDIALNMLEVEGVDIFYYINTTENYEALNGVAGALRLTDGYAILYWEDLDALVKGKIFTSMIYHVDTIARLLVDKIVDESLGDFLEYGFREEAFGISSMSFTDIRFEDEIGHVYAVIEGIAADRVEVWDFLRQGYPE